MSVVTKTEAAKKDSKVEEKNRAFGELEEIIGSRGSWLHARR
jgi:hypothetical protein